MTECAFLNIFYFFIILWHTFELLQCKEKICACHLIFFNILRFLNLKKPTTTKFTNNKGNKFNYIQYQQISIIKCENKDEVALG